MASSASSSSASTAQVAASEPQPWQCLDRYNKLLFDHATTATLEQKSRLVFYPQPRRAGSSTLALCVAHELKCHLVVPSERARDNLNALWRKISGKTEPPLTRLFGGSFDLEAVPSLCVCDSLDFMQDQVARMLTREDVRVIAFGIIPPQKPSDALAKHMVSFGAGVCPRELSYV